MSTVHQLSPAAEAALATARESGRAQGIEEGRAQVRADVEGIARAAAEIGIAPHLKRFDETIQQERTHHAQHIKAVAQARLWLGACLGIVIGSLASSAGIAYVFKDAQMTNAAARGIEQRGGASVLPAPTLCDPAVEQCLPDTNNRDTGYDRPGRAPRSAP